MPSDRRLRLGLALVVVLALLTPTVVLLRLARDPGSEPPLVKGAARSIFDPEPRSRRVALVPEGAREGRLELPTPTFPPLSDFDLGVRLLSVPAGATVALTGRDETGGSVVSCRRRVAQRAEATVVGCPVTRPEAVRSVLVTVSNAPGPVTLEARVGAAGLTAAGLYADPAPRDLAGRVDRALDRLGVLRPVVASPPVLLGAWAGSLLLGGAAFLLLLGSRRPPA